MRPIKFRYWTGEQMVQVRRLTFNGDEFIVEGEGFVHFGKAKSLIQYTGLKDINGVEIYEGDIISSRSIWLLGNATDPQEENHSGIVEFDLDFDTYALNCGADIFTLSEVTDFDNYRVIGNIYENPELMRVPHE